MISLNFWFVCFLLLLLLNFINEMNRWKPNKSSNYSPSVISRLVSILSLDEHIFGRYFSIIKLHGCCFRRAYSLMMHHRINVWLNMKMYIIFCVNNIEVFFYFNQTLSFLLTWVCKKSAFRINLRSNDWTCSNIEIISFHFRANCSDETIETVRLK